MWLGGKSESNLWVSTVYDVYVVMGVELGKKRRIVQIGRRGSKKDGVVGGMSHAEVKTPLSIHLFRREKEVLPAWEMNERRCRKSRVFWRELPCVGGAKTAAGQIRSGISPPRK